MSTLNIEMPQMQQQQVVDGNSGVGGLTTTHNGGNNSVASDSGIESSGASISNASSTTSPHITNNNNNNKTNEKNTVSAAADSSDNQPSTPQPQNEVQQQSQTQQQQQQQQQLQPILHQPYAENTQQQHQIYANTNTANATYTQMYANGMYGTADQQQSQQQQQQQQQNYGNFMPNYDAYYQQQQGQQNQQQNFANNANGNLMFSNNNNSNNNNNNNVEYKRYHPYAMGGTNAATDLPNDNNNKQHMPTTILPNNNAVSTTRNISPNLVSSSSPSSTSVHMHYGTGVAGTPNSPNGNNRQCKKCGIMCSSESELQEHVSNVHGSSPYGSSSGYSSSPFIKEEPGVITAATTNTGDILDLDSQKMVYPHELPAEQHENAALHDNPLHSMHTMQQRALPSWEQTANMPTAGVTVYYGNKQNNLAAFGEDIKPSFMKSEFPDSQQFAGNAVSGTDISQQQNASTVMSIASPVEFPSTTTADITQELQQNHVEPTQQQQQQQAFRNPTTNAGNSVTSKPAAWKSNEARRPKTYNCTACNKWFTSSGHLKRHYNTTLHKNAVKSSNQPDPATLPISAHHHPARDPNSKHNRRNSQQARTVPVSETPVSPTDYASVSSQSAAHMSNYSASPSPTQNGYQHQFIQQQQQQTSNISPILSGVASPTTSNGSSNNLNGHPNALAGPSVPIAPTTLGTTMSSSQMRGLLNTTIINWLKNETSMEEDATIDKTMGVEDQQLQQQQPPPPEHMELEQQQTQEFLSVQKQEQLEQEQLLHYHTNNNNSSSSSIKLTSPHTICHQAYLEQQQQQQMVVDSTYSPIQSPQQQQQQLVHLQAQQQEHNTMEQQRQQQPLQLQQDIIQHLDININNMQQQQPQQSYITHIATTAVHTMDMQDMQQQQQQRLESPVALEGMAAQQQQSDTLKLEIMEEHQQDQLQVLKEQQHQQQQQQPLPSMQQHCHTLLNNTNLEGLDSMLTHTHINMQPQQHMQRIINMHTMLPLTTITAQQLQQQHMHTPLLQPHTTNTTTTTIPCFQQLQQQAVGSLSASPALVPLEPTMTYHTIIGNAPRYTTSNNNMNNNNNTIEQQIVSANDFLQLTSNTGFDTYATQGMHSQLLENNDIQILQLVSAPQASYITFPQQQQQQQQQAHVNTDNNNEQQLLTYNGFVPIAQNLETLEHARADSTQSFNQAEAEQKPNVFIINANSDEICELDQLLLIGKKKNLKRKRRTVKSKTLQVVENQQEIAQEHLEEFEHQNQDERRPPPAPTNRIQCPECPKTFTKPCYLTQHMKIHAGKCPFRCTKCGKRYKVEEVFKEHVARHGSTNKPHKCQTCEKQFHHKTDLRRHIEVIHKNQKKHVCHMCPKGFCRNDHLLKHIETHFRTRLNKDKNTKEPKVIQARANQNRTISSSTSTNSINFEQNNLNLNNVPDLPQAQLLTTNENSADNSPSTESIDEDDVELLEIENQQRLNQSFGLHSFGFREVVIC